jgi:hypothetical protein
MESVHSRSHDDPYAISTHLARSTGSLVVPVPVTELGQVMDDVPHAFPELRLVSSTATGATFTRRMSFWTWGMRITLDFESLAADRTLIRATSRPKVSTTLLDWGQGARDLAMLLGTIDRSLAAEQPRRDIP